MSGGFLARGFFVQGFFVRGLCPGGFVWGVFVLEPFEPLSCKSSNIIYSLNCTKYEQSLYIGETGYPLPQRMNGHRSCVSHDDKQVYQHFQLPGYSPSVQILGKVHKKFEVPN